MEKIVIVQNREHLKDVEKMHLDSKFIVLEKDEPLNVSHLKSFSKVREAIVYSGQVETSTLPGDCKALVDCVEPGTGKLVYLYMSENDKDELNQKLMMELMMAGFVDMQQEDVKHGHWNRKLICKVPLAEMSAPAALPVKKKWVVVEDDIVDEDDLLDDLTSTAIESANSCATKRRACKDCSCGRKELEENDQVPIQSANSNCGNVRSLYHLFFLINLP